jgi:hypothetical protein
MQAPVVRPALPTEIVCKILSSSRYFEGDANFPPGPEVFDQYCCCKYRYTRFALKARRVCRLWRDIVDIPSNYWFRVSAATLRIHIIFEVDVNSTELSGNANARVRTILTPTKDGQLQEVITRSRKSLLILTLDILSWPSVIRRDVDEQGSKGGIQNCINPSANRCCFEDRIIQLVVVSVFGKYQDYLPEIVESFGCESIRRVSLLTEGASMNTGGSIISDESGLPEAALKWTPRETPLLHFKDLEHLSLRTNQKINELCHLPPFVTEMRLDGDGIHCDVAFLELRLVLGAIGSQLKVLAAAVSHLTEAEDDRLTPDRASIHLPKLTSITLGKGPVTFVNFLLELDCPKLEKGSVIEEDYPRDCVYLSRRVDVSNPQVNFPALKMLQIVLCGERSSLPLEAFSMPYLQSLAVVEKGDSETLELDELPFPIRKRLSALSLRSLHIYSEFKSGKGLASFLKYLNFQSIEELYVNHPSILDFFECFPKLVMPQPRYLELVRPNPTSDTLSLDQFVSGENLATLRLNSPLVNSKGTQKLYGITTLVLAQYWDVSVVPSINKLDLLLHLCPNLTSLGFTNRRPSDFKDIMSVLCPTSCTTQRRECFMPEPNEKSLLGSSQIPNQLVPKLQHLTVELRFRYKLDDVDDWRPKIMVIVSKIDAQRRAVGAAPLLSFTIAILQDAYEKPEAIDYPPESEGGVCCRVLLVDKQGLPSNLLTKDQINREH